MDKCSGGTVLVKSMIEKSYLPVSFLAHFIYMLVPAMTVCDPDAQIFVFIDKLKGFVATSNSTTKLMIVYKNRTTQLYM